MPGNFPGSTVFFGLQCALRKSSYLNVLIKLINLMRIPASICDKARIQFKNRYPEENYA